MKKLALLSLMSLLTLTACPWQNEHNDTKEVTNLKIICPTGAPAVAFYKYAGKENFITNSVPTNIQTYFSSGDADVIVMDTTTGIQNISKGADYKIAATITLGNFYLVSTSEDNKEIDIDDNIILFGNKEAIPFKVFNYLYGEDYNYEFTGGGVAKAAQALNAGKNMATGNKADWVWISEPYLYSCKNNPSSIIYNKDVTVVNIQELYASKTSNLPLMQASVFIKNTVTREDGDTFLENLEKDIQGAIDDPVLMMEYMNLEGEPEKVESKFGVSSKVAMNVMKTNGLGLGFKMAIDNKTAIDHYLTLFGLGKVNAKDLW